MLRTRFVQQNRLPQQIVAPHEPFALELLDLRGGPADAKTTKHSCIVSRAGNFDLAVDPMLRAGLVRLRDDESVLALALHHIAADGWSLEVLDRELDLFYSAFDCGLPAGMSAKGSA